MKVQILNGDKVVQEIEVSENWLEVRISKLPKYENGKEIKYTVKETAMTEYKATITSDKDGKYTITNEHTPEKTSVKVRRSGKMKITKMASVQHLSP